MSADTAFTPALDAEMAKLLTPKKKVPLDNFPLPRELRDAIYELLLSSQVVRHGLRTEFSTNILGVNKTIKEEAEEWLYKHSTFVVVSHKIADLSQDNRAVLDLIPKFTKNKEKIQRMKHYSLHIHFTRGHAPSYKHAAHLDNTHVSPQIAKAQLEWFLMLADDLDLFAAAMNVLQQTRVGSGLTIGDGVADNYVSATHAYARSATSVQFKLVDTKYRAADKGLQYKLFGAFEDQWASEGMKVIFSAQGVAIDPILAERLKLTMGPKLVWAVAKRWSLIRTLRKLQEACWKETDEGSEQMGFAAFDGIMSTILEIVYSGPHPGIAKVEDSGLRLDICVREWLLNIAWMAVRLDKMECFEAAMHNMMVSTGSPEQHVQDGLCTMSNLAYIHLLIYSALHIGGGAVCTNRQFLQGISVEAPSPWLQHDLKLMTERAKENPDQRVSADILPLHLSAIRTMKPPVYGFVTTQKNHPLDSPVSFAKAPRSLIGWQDMAVVGSLPDALEYKIHKSQDHHGFAATDLDDMVAKIKNVRFPYNDRVENWDD